VSQNSSSIRILFFFFFLPRTIRVSSGHFFHCSFLFALSSFLFLSSCDQPADPVWSDTKEPEGNALHFADHKGLEHRAGVPKGGTYVITYNIIYWPDDFERQKLQSLELAILVGDSSGTKSHFNADIPVQENGKWLGESKSPDGSDKWITGILHEGIELPKGETIFLIYSNHAKLRSVSGIMKFGMELREK